MTDPDNSTSITAVSDITTQPVKYYTNLLRVTLSNIAAIASIATIIGYGINQGYLSRVTDMTITNIDLSQYLVAAGSMALHFFLFLLNPAMLLILVVAGALIYFFVHFGFAAPTQTSNAQEPSSIKIVRFLERVLGLLEWLQGRVNRWLSVFLLVVLIYFIAHTYGYAFYGSTESALGGGEPSTVILVFDEPQEDVGWPFAINPTQPRQTQPIEMLMQLTDGVLVRDPQYPVPVIVKADSIRAIIDASPQRQPPPTATTTPSAAPTATP